MRTLIKVLAALTLGAGALGFTAASADHDDDRYGRRYKDRPEHCDIGHDHRSHAANYYDYYPADRYYSAGTYRGSGRGSGVSLSVRIGDEHYRGRRGHYYNDYGYGGRYRGGKPVHREVYDTHYRARIVVTERVMHGRRGPSLVCTVSARGPEPRYVPYRRLQQVARRECSPRAHVVIDA